MNLTLSLKTIFTFLPPFFMNLLIDVSPTVLPHVFHNDQKVASVMSIFKKDAMKNLKKLRVVTDPQV